MKIDTKTTISPKDYKFVNVNPDPDFDPKHNQEVIDFTIKRSEELWRKKQREFGDAIKERSEAISTYVEALKMGNTNSDVNKFFGEQQIAYFKGHQLMENLKKKHQLGEKLTKKVKAFYASQKQQRPA